MHAHKPLDGVRVLDLTRLLPGSYATLLLADLGADVIKLEDPRGGDHARHMPPLANGTSVYFHVLNRNKRSVTLDLRSPDAVPVLDALAAKSDVIVDSFRPRTAKRLGVDAATLRERHPRLICASITGFGQTGPYVDRAAHDINYEALAGLLTLKSEKAPRVPGLLIGDIGAAMNTAAGILAALFQRERTGVGAEMDVSIHESALAWMIFPSAPQLVGTMDDAERGEGVPAERVRGAGAPGVNNVLPLTGENACYNLYETADGQWLALGALEAKFWVGFCERIERPELAPLHHAQGDERARVLREVRDIMRSRTRDEWLARFAGVDVCLSPVNSLSEALADPHVVARGVVARDGGTTYITPPHATIRPAPSLGADTDDVLERVGIDSTARARLRANKII